MKIKRGQVYKTRTGTQVRILCTNRKTEREDRYRVVGLALYADGTEGIVLYELNGTYLYGTKSDLDLISLVSSPASKTKNELTRDLAPTPSRYLIAFWNPINGETRFFKAGTVHTLSPDWQRMPLLDK